MAIKFRPHHFLCALCFKGYGYTPTFVRNFSNIMTALKGASGDSVVIEVIQHTDSICVPCPHRSDDSCSSQRKIQALDHAHSEALHIKPGQKLTWGQAKKNIHAYLTLQKFREICATCEWKESGICETVLKEFLGFKAT